MQKRRSFLFLLLLLQSVGHVWSDALWDKLPGATKSSSIWEENKPHHHLESATTQMQNQESRSRPGMLQRLAQWMKKSKSSNGLTFISDDLDLDSLSYLGKSKRKGSIFLL